MQFQPGHIVRGIDFTEDPLLQGRIYSYLDTQINRHGGPNFEQLPINRPHVPINNNNRDGAGQNFIPLNNAAYSPNTLNSGSPKQANQTAGRGFFTAPGRTISGNLNRKVSSSFADVWSQPRLFYNSLIPAEQQFLINAIRFEVSHLQSLVVKQNVLIQLNRVSNDIARRVADALGLKAPAADDTYYHDNKTTSITIFNTTLPTIATLNVGVLASVSNGSLSKAAQLATAYKASGVNAVVVAETLAPGVNQTYSAADASGFDGVVVLDSAASLFTNGSSSTFFPASRPAQILGDAFRWGKPVGVLGGSAAAGILRTVGVANSNAAGVYVKSDIEQFVKEFEEGLKIFRFVDRFALDA